MASGQGRTKGWTRKQAGSGARLPEPAELATGHVPGRRVAGRPLLEPRTGFVNPPGWKRRHDPPQAPRSRLAAKAGRRQSPGRRQRPPGQGRRRPSSGHGTAFAGPASVPAVRPSSRSPRLPFWPDFACWPRFRSGKVRNCQESDRHMARKRPRKAVQGMYGKRGVTSAGPVRDGLAA